MKERILETIKSFETIIIHRHVRPDPDALGSQGGLAELLKASFPEKKIYIVGENEESLLFLNKMDEIDDKLYRNALVIICDTANQERIDDNRYSLGEKIIKIDHHPNEDQYGDIIWVDTSASSCSEMIYELFLYGHKIGLKLPTNAARLIFAGIVGDTGRFLYQSTSSKTLIYAGELIKYRFSFSEIYQQLYKTKQNVSRLSGYVLQHYLLSENGVGQVVITKKLLNQFGATSSEASQLVSILGEVEGICVWAFFVEEDDLIRVRLRSKGPIINEIAKKYKGGGHPLAAGASIYSWEEVSSVMKDLENLFLDSTNAEGSF